MLYTWLAESLQTCEIFFDKDEPEQLEKIRHTFECVCLALHRMLSLSVSRLSLEEVTEKAQHVHRAVEGYFSLLGRAKVQWLITPRRLFGTFDDMLEGVNIHSTSEAYVSVRGMITHLIDVYLDHPQFHWEENECQRAFDDGKHLALYIVEHQPPFMKIPIKHR